MTTDMMEMLSRARNTSCPIVGISTSDEPATIREIGEHANFKNQPLVQYDCATGLIGLNDDGEAALKSLGAKPEETIDFVVAMGFAKHTPQGTILIVRNAHRQLVSMEPRDTAQAVQSVANLRNPYKKNFRMAILLAPHFIAPVELKRDVVLLEYPLPTTERLVAIVDSVSACVDAATQKKITKQQKKDAVEALSGLSEFESEQNLALSITLNGIDVPAVWDRKVVSIEQTPGLSVWKGTEKFDDIIGLDAVKEHLRNRLNAKTPIGVVVFVDEIDKALANVEQDTSGVKMDQFRTMLTEMENNEWNGMVAVGVNGGGKSLLAKAFGREAGVPTIAIDLGGMESKYVGDSEAYIRNAMKIIKSMGSNHAYWIATSNNATVMRPEMQRRFTDGMWMVDLIAAKERAAAWRLYMAKYGLTDAVIPNDSLWTAAEIRNCCRYSWDTGKTLVESARFIIPIAQSRGDEIEKLRQYAHGRFLDATKGGSYVYSKDRMVEAVRAITIQPGPSTLQ